MIQKLPMRLSNFPIMFFALIMGFGGVAIVLEKAHKALYISFVPALGLSWLTFIFFVVVTAFYIAKFIKYRDSVIKEFAHPVRINFYAAFSISLLLISMQTPAKTMGIDVVLAYLGVVLQSYISLYVIRFWIERSLEISHSSPAWFIPVVGNLMIPLAASDLLPFEMLYFYFSVGMFFWIILFSVLAYRLIFHPQMAQKFVPTLFIFIAPPVFGFLNYIKLFGEFDNIAIMFYNIAVFFVILLAFMYRNFLKIRFFISWWAFIFPLAAFTLSTIILYEHYRSAMLLAGSYIMLFVSTIMLLIVSYKTIVAISKKEICIEE